MPALANTRSGGDHSDTNFFHYSQVALPTLKMRMTLHLIKLCVGARSIADLAAWQQRPEAQGPDGLPRHITRQTPRAAAELLQGGSLFWVIGGLILVRQRLIALEPVSHGDGVARCALVLDPVLVPTVPRPCRPFQGWRYLDPAQAPPDLPSSRVEEATLPAPLAAALAEIGIL